MEYIETKYVCAKCRLCEKQTKTVNGSNAADIGALNEYISAFCPGGFKEALVREYGTEHIKRYGARDSAVEYLTDLKDRFGLKISRRDIHLMADAFADGIEGGFQ